MKALIVALTLSVMMNTWAQPLYSDKDKKQIYDGAYEGCITKQQKGELNKFFKPAILPKFCECIATDVTDSLLGSIDFQIALKNKNNAQLKTIATKAGEENETMQRFGLCMGNLQKQYGGYENMLRDTIKPELFNKIGLTGDSRSSFIYSGKYTCIQDVKSLATISDRKMNDYCDCAFGYMADRLSMSSLIDMLRQDKVVIKKLSDIGMLAAKQCASKLQ